MIDVGIFIGLMVACTLACVPILVHQFRERKQPGHPLSEIALGMVAALFWFGCSVAISTKIASVVSSAYVAPLLPLAAVLILLILSVRQYLANGPSFRFVTLLFAAIA